MLRPVTISTVGSSSGANPRKAARAAAPERLDTHAGRRIFAHRSRHRALRDHVHRHGSEPADLVDREWDRDPHRHAVGERLGTVALHGVPGLHAQRHHRRVLRDDARHAVDRPADADQQRAVPDRHDHARGRAAQLFEDLLADGLVAVELGGLRAVLEERQLVRLRVLFGEVLRVVQVRADPVQLSTELLEQAELGLARLLRHEHHRPHAHALGGPGAGRAVVARRGGDHAVRAARPKRLERRQRPAPLERPELVPVLPLQEQRPSPRERGRRLLERCGRIGDSGDTDDS